LKSVEKQQLKIRISTVRKTNKQTQNTVK